jgi:hypothetical protein
MASALTGPFQSSYRVHGDLGYHPDRAFEQLAFGFAHHELRQLRDNRSDWDKRLAQ